MDFSVQDSEDLLPMQGYYRLRFKQYVYNTLKPWNTLTYSCRCSGTSAYRSCSYEQYNDCENRYRRKLPCAVSESIYWYYSYYGRKKREVNEDEQYFKELDEKIERLHQLEKVFNS